MPLIENLIDRLAQSKVISVLDLVKGYYLGPVHPNSVDKTAFVTPLGKYSFLVMPLGLCGAPTVFQRLMNTVLDGLVKLNSCYIDDIAVYSASVTNNFEHLRKYIEHYADKVWRSTLCLSLLGYLLWRLTLCPSPRYAATRDPTSLYALVNNKNRTYTQDSDTTWICPTRPMAELKYPAIT